VAKEKKKEAGNEEPKEELKKKGLDGESKRTAFLSTLPDGWKEESSEIKSGTTAGRVRRIWVSPEGKRYKSMMEVKRALGLIEEKEKEPAMKKQKLENGKAKVTKEAPKKTKGKKAVTVVKLSFSPFFSLHFKRKLWN